MHSYVSSLCLSIAIYLSLCDGFFKQINDLACGEVLQTFSITESEARECWEGM